MLAEYALRVSSNAAFRKEITRLKEREAVADQMITSDCPHSCLLSLANLLKPRVARGTLTHYESAALIADLSGRAHKHVPWWRVHAELDIHSQVQREVIRPMFAA